MFYNLVWQYVLNYDHANKAKLKGNLEQRLTLPSKGLKHL